MILMHGNIITASLEEKDFNTLYDECMKTLNDADSIHTSKVIHACDTLYRRIMEGKYNAFIFPLLEAANLSCERFQAMVNFFSKEELEYKCKMELGERLTPLKNGMKRKRYPLGVLFHIAAGNVDGLPAYSVIEGLLAGNINILKLPSSDHGLSIRLLYELIQIEPDLKNFIYVFDVPSVEENAIKRLAGMADGIVVWGGDETVQAVRKMADVSTKIIDWGHKLSFAYMTSAVSDEDLYHLAVHVCKTNQVLCSSCQGIFVDTTDFKVLEEIAQRFFCQLKKANQTLGRAAIGMRGKNTLRLYTDLLEEQNCKILSNEGISVVIKYDQELELSYLFRNVWIRALPRDRMIEKMKPQKSHLQTCGLFCEENQREELAHRLAKAGVVRITGADMSRIAAGEAHDGRYPLAEYSRIVEIE